MTIIVTVYRPCKCLNVTMLSFLHHHDCIQLKDNVVITALALQAPVLVEFVPSMLTSSHYWLIEVTLLQNLHYGIDLYTLGLRRKLKFDLQTFSNKMVQKVQSFEISFSCK